MTHVFAPGCALLLYKPALADAILTWLTDRSLVSGPHLTCCRHDPHLARGTVVVNLCPGCDRRYRWLYEGITTVSLWEVLADSDFAFPDHIGVEMTIHDACPTRKRPAVHDAVRTLLRRMNIAVIEPTATRGRATCCGDTFYGALPTDKLLRQMERRAAGMPRDEVVVYCVSCIKSMANGGRQPRHLVDLLFGEETIPGVVDPDRWHAELDAAIAAH